MIPQAYLHAWSTNAPWPDFRQIEQDLIICRALCDLFNAPALRGKIAFRGGTAINKLLFARPLRYSEDIDLVQMRPEPIGPTVDAIREALAWLGPCNREQAGHSMHLVFRFAPEADPQSTLKLKVEINTREHESLFGVRSYPFALENGWYQGQADIATWLRASSSWRSTWTSWCPASTTTSPWRARPSHARWPSSACWKSSRAT